jgi:hypothetical protein
MRRPTRRGHGSLPIPSYRRRHGKYHRSAPEPDWCTQAGAVVRLRRPVPAVVALLVVGVAWIG